LLLTDQLSSSENVFNTHCIQRIITGIILLLPSFGAPLVVLAEEDAHFATALADDIINPMCYDHSRNYLQAYFKEEHWASKKILLGLLKNYRI